jgi:hypothetical protein
MIIKKYLTEEEAEVIKQEQAALGNVLTDIANITEGNFLGFREPVDPTPTIEPAVQERLAALEEQNLILMDAIATVYEKQLEMAGGVA